MSLSMQSSLLLITHIAYFIVIALHVYFAILEMLLWKKKAPGAFGVTPQFAQDTAAMASNQGLYNAFLVAALLGGVTIQDAIVADAFVLYGLGCVCIAGIWGAITVNKRIFFVQALPGLITLGLYLFVRFSMMDAAE